jgi:carotenoid cleavage dioxygenase-like enzyme
VKNGTTGTRAFLYSSVIALVAEIPAASTARVVLSMVGLVAMQSISASSIKILKLFLSIFFFTIRSPTPSEGSFLWKRRKGLGRRTPRFTLKNPYKDAFQITQQNSIIGSTCSNNDESLINGLFEDSLDEVESLPLQASLAASEKSTIPAWLQGHVLIRNGPAIFGTIVPNKGKKSANMRRYTHVFDGLARLTRYEFRSTEGSEEIEIKFSAKFLNSFLYQQIVANQGDIPPTITTGPVLPKFTLLQRLYSIYLSICKFDNVPVNIHQLGGSGGPWVATTDSPVMVQFDPHSLETKGKITYRNRLFPSSIELFSTAHPHSRKSYTYNYALEIKPHIPSPLSTTNAFVAHIVRTDTSLNRIIVGSISLPSVPYIHDFSLTDNYAILCIWPVTIDLATILNGNGLLPQLKFTGRDPTNIYVFNISTFDNSLSDSATISNPSLLDPVATFQAPPMFAYHHINAYENGSEEVLQQKAMNGTTTTTTTDNTVEIIMDVTGYENPAIVNGKHAFAYIQNVITTKERVKQERDGTCYRFQLSLLISERPDSKNNKNKPQWVQPVKLYAFSAETNRVYSSELVRINPQCRGKKYRYSYGFTGFAGEEAFKDWALVKQDHSIQEVYPAKRQNDDLTGTSGQQYTSTRSSAQVWMEKNCYPSEPVFIPKPCVNSAEEEDDGVVVSQVYDGVRKETFLLVLDGKSMLEIARYYTGIRCPISFHGDYHIIPSSCG